jgi:hypothetical protein
MPSFSVLEVARNITEVPDLDFLQGKNELGIPIHTAILRWLANQPPQEQLFLDFSGIVASNASVTEQLGPLLMQNVQQSPGLEHRYPVYRLDNAELTYNFASAFANASATALALVRPPVQAHPLIRAVHQQGPLAYAVLGQLSRQMVEILLLADRRTCDSEPLTSESLSQLDFLTDVSAPARSKRLTELYSRRLLAYDENPRNPKERLFMPVWRLPDG